MMNIKVLRDCKWWRLRYQEEENFWTCMLLRLVFSIDAMSIYRTQNRKRNNEVTWYVYSNDIQNQTKILKQIQTKRYWITKEQKTKKYWRYED